MSFNTSDAAGSSEAVDYFDMMNQLVQMATSQRLTTVAVNNPGTGGTYVVDDILTIDNAGATRTHDVTLRVTAVTAGQIDSLRIETAGAYTVLPTTTTGNALTGGGGTGATANLTFTQHLWSVNRRSQEALSATVATAGTGYTVGDDITLNAEDSLGNTINAVFNVDTVSGGTVLTVSLVTAGLYEEVHGTPANIGVTGGTGNDDCELNVTFQDADQDEAVVILESSTAGTPIVGIRVYSDTDVSTFETVYNWSLSAFTGFNSGLLFANQAGISPGDDRVLGTGGAYVTLRDTSAGAFDIDWWISITDRRILGGMATRDTGINHYPWFHLGFLNQMGTPAEFPYPMFVCGSTSRFNSWYQDTVIARVSGLPELVGRAGSPGPGFVRMSNDTWGVVRNSNGTDSGSPSRTSSGIVNVLWPCGRPIDLPAPDETALAGLLQMDDIIPRTGVPGTETYKLLPTPMTGGDLHRRYPATIITADAGIPEYNLKGEVEGLFWVSVATSGASLTSESVLTEAATFDRFRVLQCGNRTLDFSYGCMRED